MRNGTERVEIEIIPEDARRYLRGDIDDEEYYSSDSRPKRRHDAGYRAGGRDYRTAREAETASARH
ncbi:hypothetical protein COUCH_34110 [Couchioplanes caeruleus]|uniref:hypothetical protein n=1 Tax=Couchioplanes caeruleus TaxID=56438 RepID=UPI0020C01D99|nr:hypothetical protein [Couchioplanes caeruleus]UQU63959.1 hypothetical protein COUCH_34110 [Couchioplanes caeruleus]